jgi:hypothetical protein
VVGRPTRRSVDSQTESLDIEPRNFLSRREPSLLTQAGAAPARRDGRACRSHRGPRPRRTVTRVLPGTWEVCPLRRILSSGHGSHRTQAPGPRDSASSPRGSERQDAATVSSGERNEPEEMGEQKSECRIVPGKQGNSCRGNPVEGRGHRTAELVMGNTSGPSSPGKRVSGQSPGSIAHASPQDDEPDALMAHVRICGRRWG